MVTPAREARSLSAAILTSRFSIAARRTSPLSTGVAPFRVANDRRQLAVKLEAPERVRPGERVSIGFSTPRPARVVVWAVDEGIHRVTSYKSPQPLASLIRKPSLEDVFIELTGRRLRD